MEGQITRKKRGKERGQNWKCSSNGQGAAWEVGELLVEHGQQCMIRNSPGERERATERWWVCWTARLIGWLFCKRWVSYRVKELERASGRAAEAGQCVWSHDTLHDALHAPTANTALNLKTIPVSTATHRGSRCCKTMCFLQSPLGRSQKKDTAWLANWRGLHAGPGNNANRQSAQGNRAKPTNIKFTLAKLLLCPLIIYHSQSQRSK